MHFVDGLVEFEARGRCNMSVRWSFDVGEC